MNEDARAGMPVDMTNGRVIDACEPRRVNDDAYRPLAAVPQVGVDEEPGCACGDCTHGALNSVLSASRSNHMRQLLLSASVAAALGIAATGCERSPSPEPAAATPACAKRSTCTPAK